MPVSTRKYRAYTISRMHTTSPRSHRHQQQMQKYAAHGAATYHREARAQVGTYQLHIRAWCCIMLVQQ